MGEVIDMRAKERQYVREEIVELFLELIDRMTELYDEGADDTDMVIAVAMLAVGARKQVTPSEWERITKLAAELVEELDAEHDPSEDESS